MLITQILVLRRTSFVVRRGQIVALVGMSGAGKSTCVGLMERFYDPCDGVVLIDGVDVRTLNLLWLRSQIGVRTALCTPRTLLSCFC